MKLYQLIEYNKRTILLQNKAGRLVPGPFFKKKQTLFKVKASGLQLGFTIFR